MERVKSVKIIISVIIITLYSNDVDTQSATRTNRLISYSIPEARPLQKALGYYEDTYLNFTEISTKYGYATEEHTVITEDGYILTVFRILPKCQGLVRTYPVLLLHGLFATSDVWILPGPQTSIGFILADNCYDVWAVNHRGNSYSRRHINLDPNKDEKYWNYSFDEHGNFDIPATIDYVLMTTKRDKVTYIGHSQGTSTFFAMASLRPEYNEKIKLSIQLAPVAFMTNIISPIPKTLALITEGFKIAVDSAGYSELLAKHQLAHFILKALCQISPSSLCGSTMYALTGKGSIPSKTLAIAFGHIPSGASSKSLAHYGQLINSKRFHRYDEGTGGNIKRYGSPKPAEYNVSRITSPVVLFSGRNDWLSSLKDVDTLSRKLPNLVDNYVIPDPNWSHNDYLWGAKAPDYVFSKILKYFDRFN